MRSSAERRRHASRAAAALAVFAPLALALAISFAVTPDDIDSGRVVLTPACPWSRLLRAPCPTCGLTRAFSALSHGDLDDARGHHRGALPVYALFWLGAAASAIVALRSAIRLARAGAAREQHRSLHPETTA